MRAEGALWQFVELLDDGAVSQPSGASHIGLGAILQKPKTHFSLTYNCFKLSIECMCTFSRDSSKLLAMSN